MKINNREDARDVAKNLAAASAGTEVVADALLRAHLEGIDKARDVVRQASNEPITVEAFDRIWQDLDARGTFIRSQIRQEDRSV